MNVDKIYDALSIIQALLNKNNSHMQAPFDMVVGGLVLPSLVKGNPSLLDDDNFKDMIRKYSKANILKILEGGEEKVVEKVVTVEKVVEKIIDHQKHRRIKDGYTIRPKKMKRILTPSDRDIIIEWWNKEQRLAGKNDPICEELATIINTGITNPDDKLAAYQVNGFISHLCRLGMKTPTDRNLSIDKAMTRGDFNIFPKYSTDMLALIEQKLLNNRDDKNKGVAERTRLRAARKAA
jgi:hypothetical protein